jgi:type II secretory pathway pseudopilin PulG
MLKTLTNSLILLAILTVASAAVVIPLLRWQKRKQKRNALRDYIRRVGRVLRARYGKQPSYDPYEVKQMLKKWGYSTPFDCYCLALYCNDLDFDSYHRDIGEVCDYQAMRQEMCDYLPTLGRSFDATDVMDLGDHINHHPDSHDGSYSDSFGDSVDSTSDFITSDTGSDYSGGSYDAGGSYSDGGSYGGYGD